MTKRTLRTFLLKAGLSSSLILTLSLTALAQSPPPTAPHQTTDITGDWQGFLEFPSNGTQPGAKLRIVLRIAKSPDGSLTALNYSIDQSSEPAHTSAVTLTGRTFRYTIPAYGAGYEGQLSADGNAITGMWNKTNPLNFVRATKEAAWEIPAPTPATKPMAADADPSFSVATIKPSTADANSKYFRVYDRRFMTHATSLADLIEVAYGVHSTQIVGAPSWVSEDRFDVVGVPDAEGEPNAGQWTGMLQKLLAARFQLKLHHDKRAVSAYVLSIAKSGVNAQPGQKNLIPSDSTNPLPGLEFQPVPGGLLLPARNAALAQFAAMLQAIVLDRPVIDQTGIPGKFDFQLTFMPDDSQFNGHPPAVPSATNNAAPNLFDAIEQQLGLKLQPEKTPVDVLVIDHVEKPSEN